MFPVLMFNAMHSLARSTESHPGCGGLQAELLSPNHGNQEENQHPRDHTAGCVLVWRPSAACSQRRALLEEEGPTPGWVVLSAAVQWGYTPERDIKTKHTATNTSAGVRGESLESPAYLRWNRGVDLRKRIRRSGMNKLLLSIKLLSPHHSFFLFQLLNCFRVCNKSNSRRRCDMYTCLMEINDTIK